MAALARLQERLEVLWEEYFLVSRYFGRAGGGAGYTALCWAGEDGRAGPARHRQRNGGSFPGKGPFLVSSVQGRHGPPGEGPVGGYEGD